MVRNFKHRKVVPPNPILLCEKKTGPLSVNFMMSATTTRSGSNIRMAETATVASNALFPTPPIGRSDELMGVSISATIGTYENSLELRTVA
jgi:hypothetical protein